jgi:uncharacterized phage protein
MLELYMRLFEARSVNFEAKGGGSGIGRDEILGAAAAATQQHPLGNRMVLAEMGDQHSLSELDSWAATVIGGLSKKLVAVVMGRPLPTQLDKMVYASPRYDRARRKAKEHHVLAEHYAKKGDEEEAARHKCLAKKITDEAREHVINSIMTSGKCPKCRGTGVAQRKGDQCPVCNGSGGVIPDMREIQRSSSDERYKQFVKLADNMQVERSEWINVFMRQIQRERAA